MTYYRELSMNVVKLQTKMTSEILRCSACGAKATTACNCGADYEYVPAGQIAAKALAANPKKSDRAIAAEIGVSDTTVLRARRRAASNEAPEKRKGRDGKHYPAKQAAAPVSLCGADWETMQPILHPNSNHPHHLRKRGFLYRADEAIRHAQADDLAGMKVTAEMRRLALKAARVWTELATQLNKRSTT